MPDFSCENSFPRRAASTIKLKISIPYHRNKLVPQGLSRSAQGDVSGRVRGPRFSTQLPPLFIDNPFATNDHDVLLQIVEMLHSLDDVFNVERMFRYQDDVGPPVCRSE